jgi:hypothetical protein
MPLLPTQSLAGNFQPKKTNKKKLLPHENTQPVASLLGTASCFYLENLSKWKDFNSRRCLSCERLLFFCVRLFMSLFIDGRWSMRLELRGSSSRGVSLHFFFVGIYDAHSSTAQWRDKFPVASDRPVFLILTLSQGVRVTIQYVELWSSQVIQGLLEGHLESKNTIVYTFCLSMTKITRKALIFNSFWCPNKISGRIEYSIFSILNFLVFKPFSILNPFFLDKIMNVMKCF